MKRVQQNFALARHVVVALAATVPAFPAAADDSSYSSAFERRVTDAGNRGALDSFVVEAVNQGQYDQALSTLEEIILRDPSDLGARLALARIYFQISAYDLAAAHLEQAVLTAGWEAYEKEIEALRARIKRGQSGYEYRLAISSGVDYKNSIQRIAFTPDENASLVSPFIKIDGIIIRDLDTASNDEIRVGGLLQYKRGISDSDFDGDMEATDVYGGRFDVTYSKGLPDIYDTLRFDITGYGALQNLGGGREMRDIGTEAELSWRPSVESQVRLFAGYGWLGNSIDFYTEHRVRYGASGELRIAPGVALGVYATGFFDRGVSPVAFAGGDTDFTADGYEAGASISHLLHVFEDGRSWVHEAGGRYSWSHVLDYATVTDFQADMVDREGWEVFWNHTVQIHTRAEMDFGVSYGRDNITDADISSDRENEFWGVKAGLTYRFN